MWPRSPIFWTLLAVTFVTSASFVYADDQSDGYKMVPVTAGGKTVLVRVKEAPDPLRNVASHDHSAPYDPQRIFSSTNPMADKKFAVGDDTLSRGDADFKGAQDAYASKSYADAAQPSTVPNLNAHPAFGSTAAFSRSANGFDKDYLTSTADAGQDHAALLASATSSDQGHTAVLGNQSNPETYASAFAQKTFQGPEAEAAHHHLTKMANGQMLVTDLPNRPLTISEVRDLINHGFKPNTDLKPEDQSKALNDPDYKPQPLRDTPEPSSPVSDDDKNDPVPPPGTMANPPPENTVPLPQP